MQRDKNYPYTVVKYNTDNDLTSWTRYAKARKMVQQAEALERIAQEIRAEANKVFPLNTEVRY